MIDSLTGEIDLSASAAEIIRSLTLTIIMATIGQNIYGDSNLYGVMGVQLGKSVDISGDGNNIACAGPYAGPQLNQGYHNHINFQNRTIYGIYMNLRIRVMDLEQPTSCHVNKFL